MHRLSQSWSQNKIRAARGHHIGKPYATEMSRGFAGAPVAKLVFVASAAGSLLLQAARANLSTLEWLWRPLAQSISFRHPGETIVGLLLQYYFRIFENHLGTARFGAYVVLSLGAGQLVQKLLAWSLGIRYAAGPYSFIFTSLVEYTLNVPPATHFDLFGWRLTDKVWYSGLVCKAVCYSLKVYIATWFRRSST